MNILIFIVILLVLVLVHEFGHFFSAKKFGIRVDEFGFGFPPRLFGKKIGETEYTFNLFPVGGFVKIFGENPDDENTNGPEKHRSFVHKPKWQQAIVLFAGIFMNFLLAWVLFSIALFSGLPTSVSNKPASYNINDSHLVIMSVLPGSPAERAGIASGDTINAVSSFDAELKEINPETFRDFITNSAGNDIHIYVDQGEALDKLIVVKPELSLDTQKYTLGVSMDQIGVVEFGFFASIWEGFKLTGNVILGTFSGLYNLIVNAIKGTGSFSDVSGPVGLVGIVGDAYKFGFIYLLSFTAIISINLGVINLVPFPALDGGRLLFLLVEKIKGSRMSTNFANTANMVGFFILIGLMILVTYHDIAKMF